ncbi:MAG: hypothetical protein K9K63_13095 [Desulfotignum sp.]|nr:hypothetical protein [Desulfotignum sp.]MCF8138237.1 hypothetical protein [Desulfotignum sp.]
MKCSVFTDEYELIQSIKNLSLKSPGIVSIDGIDGVGKSTLACKISEDLSLPRIEIDTFIQEQQGGYIEHIDYYRLNEKIKQTIIAGHVIILEGICIQQVLKRLSLNSNTKIYVKVINVIGNHYLWMDQMQFFPPGKSADEMIAERMAKRYSLGHVEDIIRYHYTFKPHENADYIFERRKA